MANGEPPLSSSDRILILTPAANSHRHDFDHVFKPESEKLLRIYRASAGACSVVRVPVAAVDPRTLEVRTGQAAFESAARTVIASLAGGTRWTHVVMVCHGWPTGLQLGFRTRRQRGHDARHWEALVHALRALSVKTITLFACSAGKEPITRTGSPGSGDDSLADLLRDAAGATVFAHTTTGHATRNPNLIAFESSESPLIGGIRLAPPGSALFRRTRLLLSNARPAGSAFASGDVPPPGHSRPAFASIPLCASIVELQALFSAGEDSAAIV